MPSARYHGPSALANMRANGVQSLAIKKGRKVMDWFNGKTSIAGIKFPIGGSF
jgi:hypothetical protein